MSVVYIHFLLPPLDLFSLLLYLPLLLWFLPPPPLLPLLPTTTILLLPPSLLLLYLMANRSTILLRVASACDIFCRSRFWAVPISVSARACSLSFCWIKAVTTLVIMSFTLLPQSIAAFALLNPLLPSFVLPVIRHTLSIPPFFFLKNMIVLAYVWSAVELLFHSITVSSVNMPMQYSSRR